MSLRARMGIAALAILTTISMTVGGAGVANASAGTPHASGDRSAASYVEYVDWYTYRGTDSTWHCGATVDKPAFYEQVCTIVNGKSYQSALIFVPKTSSYRSVVVSNVRNGVDAGQRVCHGDLTAWIRVVCFAPTRTGTSGDSVYSIANDPDWVNLYGPSVRIS
ncbi:hypothetical protein ABTX15_32645 [Micromonospora sp. NPDC094482]|uniref:hypothetical protein n=1 Tax=unclassified Micromonospora TaxID=2617518 RepID=UPI00332B6A96